MRISETCTYYYSHSAIGHAQNMALRLSKTNFYVWSFLYIQVSFRNWETKFTILTWKSWSHARIWIHWMWPIQYRFVVFFPKSRDRLQKNHMLETIADMRNVCLSLRVRQITKKILDNFVLSYCVIYCTGCPRRICKWLWHKSLVVVQMWLMV